MPSGRCARPPTPPPRQAPVIVPRREHRVAFCAQDLCKKLPYKIDIGAVFTADPRDHKKFKLFEPVQREFLIDIDLTDYEFLDCDVKKIETCDRCWPIMALAAASTATMTTTNLIPRLRTMRTTMLTCKHLS